MIVAFIFDVFTFLVVEKFEKVELNNRQYEEKIFQNKLDYQQTVLLNQSKSELGKVRHDMLNILSTAKGFIEIGNSDKAINILENATNDLSTINGIPICSNSTLNTILSIKTAHAEKSNVKLKIKIIENRTLDIDDYDLCRIIGNLIDNGINAAKDSDEKAVGISIDIDDDIIVKTKNKFNIKSEKQLTNGRHG
ncbi:MAG: GHKL domain-containing protein, partial [Clostridiales bacterium]|nr:GHKL domain-containing protein [Clostridiales bacterium]